MFFNLDAPPGLSNVSHGAAVDVGPHHSDNKWIEHVKQHAKKEIAGTHVFQEQQPSIRLANPSQVLILLPMVLLQSFSKNR